ncbi:MAG: EpsI family protein [Chromatiales bacterium]|nr:EpsI family protein [Chromatiales bacterium]
MLLGVDARLPLALLGIALLVPVLWPSFSSMLAQWETSTYSYGYLIGPVALFLLWRDRARLAAVRLQPAMVPVLLSVPVALGWAVAVLLRIDVVHQLGAVALLLLLVWSLLGTAAVRQLWFPLAYLFLMVPLGDSLIPYLMDLTANATVRAVQASGVPVYQDGYVFSLPSGNFEVVEACSGVRFLMAAVAAGAAFAYLAFEANWKRILFITACVLVGIFGNLLRAYSVVMIAHITDMEYGRNHETFGIVLNGAILLLFFLVASRFADAPAAPGSIDAARRAAPGPELRHYLPALLVAVVVGLAGWLPQSLVARAGEPSADELLRAFPAAVAGWQRIETDAAPEWQPEFAGARARRVERFRSADAPGTDVDLAMADFAALGEGADLTSSLNRMFSPPWSLLAAREAGAGESARREAALQSPDGQRRLVWWWYRVGGVWTASAVQAEWLTLRALLTGSIPVREIVAISVPLRGDQGTAARAALTAFARAADLPGAAVP